MALSGYGFAGKGLGKAETIKPKRLTPVTATLTICAPVQGICRLTCPPGIRARAEVDAGITGHRVSDSGQ